MVSNASFQELRARRLRWPLTTLEPPTSSDVRDSSVGTQARSTIAWSVAMGHVFWSAEILATATLAGPSLDQANSYFALKNKVQKPL